MINIGVRAKMLSMTLNNKREEPYSTYTGDLIGVSGDCYCTKSLFHILKAHLTPK